MKIKANIPFTYLYPEEEPSETRYYWAKETVTCEESGGYYNGTFDDATAWNALGNPSSVESGTCDIEFDGELYKNIPYRADDDDIVIGSEDPAEYPFIVQINDTRNDGTVFAKTAGEHTVALVAKVGSVNLEVRGNDASETTVTYNLFTADAESILVQNDNPDTLNISGYQQATGKANAVYYYGETAWLIGSMTNAEGATVSPESVIIDEEGILLATTLPDTITISVQGR